MPNGDQSGGGMRKLGVERGKPSAATRRIFDLSSGKARH